MSQDDHGKYTLKIDGAWDFITLRDFPKSYLQTYSFLYSLKGHHTLSQEQRIFDAYNKYPWAGGYSAVNFYNYLIFTIPKEKRLKINSISYSSPGWIELSAVVGLAVSIKLIVSAICSSARDINRTYNDIYKGFQERKLTRDRIKKEDFKMTEEETDFVNSSAELLAKQIGFTKLDVLNDLSQNDLKKLKILLSFTRRVRDLAAFSQKKIIKF